MCWQSNQTLTTDLITKAERTGTVHSGSKEAYSTAYDNTEDFFYIVTERRFSAWNSPGSSNGTSTQTAGQKEATDLLIQGNLLHH